jgi:hypothetical protein
MTQQDWWPPDRRRRTRPAPQGAPPPPAPSPTDKNGGRVAASGPGRPKVEWSADEWVERANRAVTRARELGTPTAWQEASSAAAAVATMAQTMEVMSRAHQLADDMARIAAELAEKARAAAQAASVARETAKQVDGIVAGAQSANTVDAWDKALGSATATWSAVDAASLVGRPESPGAQPAPA